MSEEIRTKNLDSEDRETLRGLLSRSINNCHCRLVEAGEKGSYKQSDLDSLVMRYGHLNQIMVKLRD